jgi:hypothetical protein
VPLHNGETVPDAQAARQAFKAEIKAGTWKTPKERGRDLQTAGTELGTGGAHGETAPEGKRVAFLMATVEVVARACGLRRSQQAFGLLRLETTGNLKGCRDNRKPEASAAT